VFTVISYASKTTHVVLDDMDTTLCSRSILPNQVGVNLYPRSTRDPDCKICLSVLRGKLIPSALSMYPQEIFGVYRALVSVYPDIEKNHIKSLPKSSAT
jgi:hypothetical protein